MQCRRSFITALPMHSISFSQSLAIHYISLYRKSARRELFCGNSKCYSINCASYNLSLVQEMNNAFYFYPTVHSLKSTNIIQEDTCFCRTILVFVGKQIYTEHFITIYIEILTAIEKSEPKWKLTLPIWNKQLCKVLNGVQ